MGNWKKLDDNMLWYYTVHNNRRDQQSTRPFTKDMREAGVHWVVYAFVYSLEKYWDEREDIPGMLDVGYMRQVRDSIISGLVVRIFI